MVIRGADLPHSHRNSRSEFHVGSSAAHGLPVTSKTQICSFQPAGPKGLVFPPSTQGSVSTSPGLHSAAQAAALSSETQTCSHLEAANQFTTLLLLHEARANARSTLSQLVLPTSWQTISARRLRCWFFDLESLKRLCLLEKFLSLCITRHRAECQR